MLHLIDQTLSDSRLRIALFICSIHLFFGSGSAFSMDGPTDFNPIVELLSTDTTVNLPSAPTVTNITACPLSTFTLSGTPGANGNSLKWYWASTGGMAIAQGSSITYSETSGDYINSIIFYASTLDTTTGRESASRAALTVTLKAVAAAPTAVTNGSVCGSGPVTLNSTVSSGYTNSWYGASWYTTPGTPLLGSSASYTTPSLSATTTYYVRAKNTTTGCESGPVAVVGTVKTIPTASAENQSIFSGQQTSISITNPNNVSGTTYNWTASTANTTGYSSGTGATIAQTLTTSTQPSGSVTYTIVPSANGCTGSSTTTVATVYPTPQVTGQSYVAKGANVTLDGGEGYSSYEWRNGINAVVGAARTYSTNVPDTYTVMVTKNGANANSAFKLGSQMDDINMNFIATSTVLVDNITDASTIDNLPVDQVSQSIQYFDGLGRPIQSVITQGSPLKKDIVVSNYYDALGRESRKYLPVITGNTGRYNSSLLDGNGNYASNLNYNNGAADKVTDDTRPFSETIFEASPLNRPSQQFGPGQSWKDNNKSTLHQYLVNKANEVILFLYDPATGLVSTGANAQPHYFAAGMLHANVTTDEHGNDVAEYIDKLGHTICKKVQYGSNTNGKLYACTYYIYDDFGNIVVVLQPEAVEQALNTLTSQN